MDNTTRKRRSTKNEAPTKIRKGILIGIPLFLLLCGILIILYAGWNLFKQTYLVSSALFNKPAVQLSEKKFLIDNKLMQRPQIGSEMGRLLISSISLDYPVIHGDDDDELSKGVGHYAGSTLPGEGGNVVLDGHRDTVFRNLGKVKIGDVITIKTNYGTYNYKAANIRIVNEDDLTVVVRSDKEMLTIYTCYPFNYIGHAPKRYVLTADYISGDQTKELKVEGGK